LSAPEAGELPSDGLSIVSDDEISTIGNNNNIYEPIDDDDDELEKLMDGDGFSETYSDATSSKKRKKQKKKSKKLKKSKKRKKRRQSSDSIEEISEDDAILDEVDNVKKLDDGFTPPLDQISYTPKRKIEGGYTPISRGTPSINATPESPLSDEAGTSKRNDYRSPHTPPIPHKRIDERVSGLVSGRHSSLSSSTSQKGAARKRHPSPERSSSYRKRSRSRERSPFDYDSNRRRRDRERSPYNSNSSRKRHDRRRRSK
jgi:hypothetical protein